MPRPCHLPSQCILPTRTAGSLLPYRSWGEAKQSQKFKPDMAANEKVVPGKLGNGLIVMVVGFA